MSHNANSQRTTTQLLAQATTVAQASNDEALKAEIARLTAENARLMQQAKARVTFKVTDKGAVSVYGMGRWPVTLYRSQWTMLLGQAENLRAFIEANGAILDGHEARYAAAKQDATTQAGAPVPVADPEAAAIASKAAELAAKVDARLAS